MESCLLCRMIHDRLELHGLIEEAKNYESIINGKYYCIGDTSINVSINGPLAPSGQKAYQLVIYCGPLNRQHVLRSAIMKSARYCWLAVEAAPTSAAVEMVARRPLSLKPMNGSTMRLAKKWIENCATHHSSCQRGYTYESLISAGPAVDELRRLKQLHPEASGERPTRLIDTKTFNDDVRLVESSTIDDICQYLALSHVWGRSQHCTTNRSNYQSHLTAIGLEELPRTFRDAILVARQLEVPYLWIDSLCIIQDDPEDWRRESMVMGTIYMNAYVVISATSARDSDGGLFFPRSPPQTSVNIDYYSSAARTTGPFTIHDDTPSWAQQVSRSVLASRAWTLQEHQLARRILHFASDQITFECQKEFKCENGWPHLAEVKMDSFPVDTIRQGLLAAEAGNAQLLDLIARVTMGFWCRIIEDYTSRALTFQSDKLIAIDGLAKFIKGLTRYDYAFGMWPDALDIGLLWRTAPYKDIRERRGRVVGRAPTWSWASIDGRLFFAFSGERRLEQHSGLIDSTSIMDSGDLKLTGHLLRFKGSKGSPNDSWTRLQLARTVKGKPFAKAPGIVLDYELIWTYDQAWFGWAAYDEFAPVSQQDEHEMFRPARHVGIDVFALLVGEQNLSVPNDPDTPLFACFFNEIAEEVPIDTAPFSKGYLILLLESTGDEDTYRRVGMGQIYPCKPFETPEPRQIIII